MKVQNLSKSILGIVLLLSLFAVQTVMGQGFVHPGCLHTQADFDRIKAQITANEPSVVQDYAKLTNNSHSSSSYSPNPQASIIRGGADNYSVAMNNAAAAYQNALVWKINGDKAHADNAVNILNAWARTCKVVTGDPNAALASGLYGYEFANAGELMRDYTGWKSDDFKKFQQWMASVFFSGNMYFLRDRQGVDEVGYPATQWSNWGLCNVLSAISIGILCDDPYIYNFGMSYYKYDYKKNCINYVDPKAGTQIVCNGFTEYIGNLVPAIYTDVRGPYGFLGQMQESGRDQGHALLSVGLSSDICQTGFNQGDDLFAYKDNRLAAAIEYEAGFSLYQAGDTLGGVPASQLPWTTYVRMYYPSNVDVMYGIAGGYGGDRPYWGRIIGYYEGVKGVVMPYSHVMKNRIGIDGGGGDYGGNSGGFDHLGFTTLTCTRPMVSPSKAPIALKAFSTYKGKTEEKGEFYGVIAGDSIKFSPQLPSGSTDTGNWEWNTGEKTRELVIKADSSKIYRVSYTGANGVKSIQLYSIAVFGDCFQEPITPTITVNSVSVNDTVITIVPGTSFTLAIQPGIGGGSYKWSNNSGSSSITVDNISTARTYYVDYTSVGGRVSRVTFHINLTLVSAALKVDGGAAQNVNTITLNAGQSVELTPLVQAGYNTGTWNWSNGNSTQNYKINNIQTSEIDSVTYTYNGSIYKLVYKIYVAVANMQIADGDYFIKDASTGLYYTNDGSLQPSFGIRSTATPLSQSWKFSKDATSGRYKIVSNLDGRFVEEHGRFNTSAYFATWNSYSLSGLVGVNLFAIQDGGDAGTKYWGINGSIINGMASATLNGYPFEIILYSTTAVSSPSEFGYSVYPNPIRDFMIVTVGANAGANALLTIYSVDGHRVRMEHCVVGENNIHTSDLPNGLYIGVLSSNGKTKTFKVVKE